jgi:hypothetical protein
MIDEDAPPAGDGEAVLYDYLKHLTSLCLLSLGGVAALADKVHGRSAISIVVALIVIGLAAASSFLATGMIVDARLSGKPLGRGIGLYRHASPILLSIGVGMFVYLFLESRPA